MTVLPTLPDLISIRRLLHQHAETGWSEFWTTAYLAEQLTQAGWEVQTGEAICDRQARMGVPEAPVQEQRLHAAQLQGALPYWLARMDGLTGLVADLRPDLPSHTALRFDIDALPGTESRLDAHQPAREGFLSLTPEAAHLCGHDGHAAIGLGVAYALAPYKHALRHNIRLIFEPAEEGVRGALPMVRAGVVDGIRNFLSGHIGMNATQSRSLACGSRGFFATTKFDVTFQGTPAHAGASPHLGHNSLLAASSAILNLHAIPRHGEGASRIAVGLLRAGSGRNIIPAEAFMACETRGQTSAINDYMFAQACSILEHTASMYGQDVSISRVGQCASACSDPELEQLLLHTASGIPHFLPDRTRLEAPGFGSDDVCTFMQAVQEQGGKATYAMLGSSLPAGHHQPDFDFEEDLLQPAAELFAQAALALDSQP